MQYPRHLILDTQLTKRHKLTTHHWSTLYTHKISQVNNPSTNTIVGEYTLSSKSTSSQNLTPFTSTLEQFPHHLFNINFLRKERLYTKLKYSRCPQYDIVGGGWAALFAGLLGFLISEKFGIELVDSGDFYNALMYAIFASFALRPLVKIIDKSFQLKDLLLLPLLVEYLLTLLTLLAKRFTKQ